MRNLTNADESYSSFRRRIKGSFVQKTKVEERNFYYASRLQKPLRNFVILFKSNHGFSMEGDAKAIFDQLLHDKTFDKYRFIWVTKNVNIYKILSQEYRRNRRVHFVELESQEYLKYMAESKYIVSDDRLPVWFIRREEQVYIKTGNRFENFRKGYQQNEKYINDTRMHEKDYLCSNILLSPSKYYTEEIYIKGFKLSNLYKGNIVQATAPRHEAIRDMNMLTAKKRCSVYGLDLKKQQILLVLGKKGLLEEKVKFCKQMVLLTSANKYQVCVKVVSEEFVNMRTFMEETGVFVIKNYMNMNLWLAAADYLVGDGAGYTFDYLATGRMIVFTDLYGIRKGELLTEEELPGPTAHTPEEAVRFIMEENKSKQLYEKNYATCVERFVSDGSKKKLFENGNVIDPIGGKLKSDKEKLLFVVSPAVNCWSTDFYQVLRQIDYETYDATVVSGRPSSYEEELEIEKNIDRNVRLLYRTGLMVQTEEKYIEFKYLAHNLLHTEDIMNDLSFADANNCKNEWIRICGYAKFDRLIYVGNPTPELLILTNYLDVKHKVYLDPEDYKNMMRDCSIFLKQVDHWDDYLNVEYQNNNYQVKDICEFEDGQIRLVMIKLNM